MIEGRTRRPDFNHRPDSRHGPDFIHWQNKMRPPGDTRPMKTAEIPPDAISAHFIRRKMHRDVADGRR